MDLEEDKVSAMNIMMVSPPDFASFNAKLSGSYNETKWETNPGV